MAIYVIKEIHPQDGHYGYRKKLIGKRIVKKELEQWHNESEMAGWLGGPARVIGTEFPHYYFLGVKIAKS